MSPDEQRAVWEILDREHLVNIARSGPDPIFATISGAHLYGFASPDSDVDLRGAFMLPARKMLGLRPPTETISIEDNRTLELDWVAHDIRKFARLMVSHNGYVLEQLFSPLVVISTAAHDELRELGKGCVTRPTAQHYQGFARGRRKRLHEPDATVKHLLYAYRVLLTGIHLMRTGEVVSNLPMLNLLFRMEQLDELIARKREGTEKLRLGADELLAHETLLDTLQATLETAYERSSLPDTPTGAGALEDSISSLIRSS